MSDPVSGTTIAAGGLMGASMFGLATGIDYGVVFGAFAGAVFYVATAANISRGKLVAYFMTSFIVGVLGAGLVGSKLSSWTGYSDRPLDALGAVLLSAMIIKVLTFLNSQDLNSLFNMLTRFREEVQVVNDPSALANAVICAVIVLALMFYQRGGSRHRPGISVLAYLMVLVYASIPFRFLFGLYESSHWLVVLANILICGAVLWFRGNVARLVDALRH